MRVFEALKETQCGCSLPWEAGAVSDRTRTPKGRACSSAAESRLTEALQVSVGISFPDSKQVLHAPGAAGWHPLHHGIEGTAAVAANSRPCLCGGGRPTLGRVGGHEQDAAAVGRVVQVCQGDPRGGQRLLQALG